MFDHVKFGVSDYAASKAFFLKALEPLGVSVVAEGPPTYGVELCPPEGKASLCLYQTEEKPARLHLAFTAESRQQVEAFYRAAMEAGGKDNGTPGLCPEYHANYYAAFVIGPDGHNIEVVCHEPEANQSMKSTPKAFASRLVPSRYMDDTPSCTALATASATELLVREHLNLTARGDLPAVEGNVTSGYFNHRCADEPMDTRGRGPEALKATIRWLHRAFTNMRFEFHEVLVVGDRAVARVTLHARQHGPFVVHDSPGGEVTDAFPSNGRSFAVNQTHWFRVTDGAVAEHDAVRDDLGMAKQLGWIPPKPIYLVRMLLTRRRERRRTA